MSRSLVSHFRVSLWSAATAAACLSGCSRNPVATFSEDFQYLSRQPGPGLVADRSSPIPDVPHPVGFKPVVSKSVTESVEPARELRHVYQGRAPLADVRLYYGQQLPLHGWRVEDQRFTREGELVLEYGKGSEHLRVRAAQVGSRSTVIVTITPR